jgi:leader peptidase (prepilin peptidase)/N-methyltransferase
LLATVVVLAVTTFHSPADTISAALATGVLVLLSAIDIERGAIPNRIVLPAALAVLAIHAVLAPNHFLSHPLGAGLAAASLLVPRLVSKEALGMGDVKMALLIGATIGPLALVAIALAFVCTFPVAIILVVVRGLAGARASAIPFAPFLAFASTVVLVAPHVS